MTGQTTNFVLSTRMLLVLFSCVFGFVFTDRNRADSTCGERRFEAIISPMHIVTAFSFFSVFPWLVRRLGLPHRTMMMTQVILETVLHTCLYDALLLPLLPLLRRHYSARACATLWLLPNALYYLIFGSSGIPRPLLVLPVDANLTGVLWLWAIGAAAVLAWRVAQHLVFRRRLLEPAHAVDAATLDLWMREKTAFFENEMDSRRGIPLLVSPVAVTPLSVGLARRAIRVVLPEQHYSADALHLIFRHELIHIARMDAWTKLFLTLCTAVLWWNPLMWLAMRRCAEDLELACDELVLLDEPPERRAAYAELLLHTAGDVRGFTTCLSASLKCLRYRLNSVLHPKQKVLGGLMLALAASALGWTCGSVAVGYAPRPLSEAAFPDTAPLSIQVSATFGKKHTALNERDAEALWNALREQTVYTLSGLYEPAPEDEYVWLTADCGDTRVQLILYDRFVHVRDLQPRNGHWTLATRTLDFCFAAPPELARLTAACGSP